MTLGEIKGRRIKVQYPGNNLFSYITGQSGRTPKNYGVI